MRKHLTTVLWIAALCCSAAAAAVPARRTNVILITMDTLRADHVGCYGDKDAQTPSLDALAKDGIVFERAISQVPLTWPSHAVILTGTYPFQNGVQDFTGTPLAPRFRTLAQGFKAHGYATGAVVSSFVLERSWGLGRGFDFYDDAFAPEAFQTKDLGLVDRKASESVTRAIRWLNSHHDRPFFLWLHLYDPHSPYDPPEPFRTQYKGRLYDGEIAYADHELGRLFDWLKQHRLYDASAIAFLSDHGESLGEHGEQEHGFFVYNSTVHIPLIVKPPSASRVSRTRRPQPVETTAVAPIMMQLAGITDPISAQFAGTNPLAPAAHNAPAYSETTYPLSSFGWSPLHALETERYHMIDAPKVELYDLASDPGETHNIAEQQKATVAVLKDALRQTLRKHPFSAGAAAGDKSGLNPDALEKLRALGYVAYRAPVSAEALAAGLPDPKDKLWEFNAILQASDALRAGDAKSADALLEKVREKDPQLYIVPFMTGEAANRRQDWAQAATDFKRCLELNPNFDQAMTGLAGALAHQGDDAGAVEWLNKALRVNPQNYRAWYELGATQARSDKAAARSAFEKSVTIQPNFAPSQRGLGMLLFQQKDYAQAATRLARATELGLQEAPLLNFLGIAYSQVGQDAKAITSYEKAVAIDPSLAEAHLNLAYAYQSKKQQAAALREYQKACELDTRFCKFVPAH